MPRLASLEVGTVRVDDPGVHSSELVPVGYQKCAVSRRRQRSRQLQGLRGDVVLGRYEVASVTRSDRRVAITVGGEGGLSYSRLRNEREDTTS